MCTNYDYMSYRPYLFAALALLLAAPLATAQSSPPADLRGRVTDGETGEPLAGVTVALPAFSSGAATDADGRYALRVPTTGSVRVVFSFIGYRPETRTVPIGAEPTVLDVVLAPTEVEIPAVTITAKARASDVLSTPQSVAVVDEEALARSGGSSAFDALDEVAGVRLLRTGVAIGKPVIRGLTAQRVVIVQDGVRQEGQDWGEEHGPDISSADVDRIEVIRGPSSLLYGSDALGGVVQTATGNLFSYTQPLTGTLDLMGITNAPTGRSDVRLGGRSGKTVYEARFGLAGGGSYETPDGLVRNTAQMQGSGTVRLGREFGEGSVVLEVQHLENKIGLFEPDAFVGGEEEGEEEGERFDVEIPYQRVAHSRGTVRVNVPVGLNRLEVVTALQQNRRHEFGEEGESSVPGEIPELFLRLTTGSADVRLHHRPVGRLYGTVGVSGLWQQNETLAEVTLIPGATTMGGAVYASEEFVLPHLTLSGGLRADVRRLDVDAAPDLGVAAQVRNYSAVTGAFGAAWQPRSDVSLAVNLGRAFRAPALIELFGDGVHEGTARYERGDADLATESALNLDGVARYLSPTVFVEVSAFVNHIGDYIFARPTEEVDPGSGLFVYDYAQADARLVGGEARVDLHPAFARGFGLHLSGDVTEGTNLETDETLPFIPPARVRTALEYRADALGSARDVTFRAGPTFVAKGEPFDAAIEMEGENGEEGEFGETEPYTVWEASAAATFRAGAVTLTPVVSVQNVLNAEYVDPLSRLRVYGVPAPGLGVQFRLIAKF